MCVWLEIWQVMARFQEAVAIGNNGMPLAYSMAGLDANDEHNPHKVGQAFDEVIETLVVATLARSGR